MEQQELNNLRLHGNAGIKKSGVLIKDAAGTGAGSRRASVQSHTLATGGNGCNPDFKDIDGDGCDEWGGIIYFFFHPIIGKKKFTDSRMVKKCQNPKDGGWCDAHGQIHGSARGTGSRPLAHRSTFFFLDLTFFDVFLWHFRKIP